MKVFSPDSKVMIAMSHLGDLIILNFIFLLTCLPVFTIGAAATALYRVSFNCIPEWSDRPLRTYFRAFRENFKQATILWLIFLGVGVCMGFDLMLFYRMPGAGHMLFLPAAILLAILLFTFFYVFPLLSQFQNGTWQTLKNALLLSLGYLPRTLLLGLTNLFPFLAFFYSLTFFFGTAFVWVFLYFAAAAYLNAWILRKVFAPYREEDVHDRS